MVSNLYMKFSGQNFLPFEYVYFWINLVWSRQTDIISVSISNSHKRDLSVTFYMVIEHVVC